MSLGKELEKLKYDKRLLEWHVNHGKLKKDELKKYLDALPDLASNIDHFGLGGDDLNGDSDPLDQVVPAETHRAATTNVAGADHSDDHDDDLNDDVDDAADDDLDDLDGDDDLDAGDGETVA